MFCRRCGSRLAPHYGIILVHTCLCGYATTDACTNCINGCLLDKDEYEETK